MAAIAIDAGNRISINSGDDTTIAGAQVSGNSVVADIGGDLNIASRQDIDTMLAFAARHGIKPQTEHFPMSRLNDALDHLRAGKARYRVVLDADFEQA